jgi:hypothetical protein
LLLTGLAGGWISGRPGETCLLELRCARLTTLGSYATGGTDVGYTSTRIRILFTPVIIITREKRRDVTPDTRGNA